MKSFDQFFRKPPADPKSHLSFFQKLLKAVALNSGKGALDGSVKSEMGDALQCNNTAKVLSATTLNLAPLGITHTHSLVLL